MTDDAFGAPLSIRLGISALKTTIGFVVPIIFALLLNEVKNPKFKKVVQSLSYMPHFISWAIFGGIMLNWMSSTGLINQIMLSLGLQSRSILYNADPDNFWTISFITDTFKETGWSAIIYLAAIAGIDPGLMNRRSWTAQTAGKRCGTSRCSASADHLDSVYPCGERLPWQQL